MNQPDTRLIGALIGNLIVVLSILGWVWVFFWASDALYRMNFFGEWPRWMELPVILTAAAIFFGVVTMTVIVLDLICERLSRARR